MFEIMTGLNIEEIFLHSLINKNEGFEKSFKIVKEDFFAKKINQELFIYLKDAYQKQKEINVELFLAKNNFSAENITHFMNLQYEYSMQQITDFFINHYKIRLIHESAKKMQKISVDDISEELEKLKESLNIQEKEETLKGSQKAIEEYIEHITKAQEDFLKSDGVLGISTGIPSLNEKIIGLKNAEYILVAGRPSMGKTSLTTGFFIEAIADTNVEGVPVMFSLEMPTKQIMGRMVASISETLDLKETIFGKNKDFANEKIEEVMSFLEKRDFYIEDFCNEEGTKSLSISSEDLDEKLKKIKAKHGKIKLIVIDYIQLMSANNKKIINQNEKVSNISNEIKSLSRKYGCPVVALSQLNRTLENRQDKRPQLSDLRDSGALEQDADIILFVYRPEVYLEKELKEKLSKKHDTNLIRQLEVMQSREFSEAEIIIGKQRNGPIGTANTYFIKKNATFRDIDESESNQRLEDIYGPPEIYD